MEDITKVKTAITGIFALITARLGILAVPVYVLVLTNLIDYFTGLAAAPHRGEKRNSATGLHGIIKKVCMWLLVVVGAIIDWMLIYATNTIGLQMPIKGLVAAVTAIWLICNELISIMENIDDIGVPLPNFLIKIVKWVTQAAEDTVDFKED